MKVSKGKRTICFMLRFSEDEYQIVSEKMKALGMKSVGVFARMMVLNGYVLYLNVAELREMIRLLSNLTNNTNQIARKLNGGGAIYETEIDDIKDQQSELWNMMNRLLTKFEQTK